MQWKPIKKVLHTAVASLSVACFCVLLHASDALQPAADTRLRETSNYWSWVALAAIVAILTVIALAARRHLPFGKKG
jgi:hypothetical protein